MRSRWIVVVAMGSSQAIAWASSFYLPAVLAQPLSRDIGLSPAWIYGALSLALFVSAALGPLCGRIIDAHGGRGMLVISNLLFTVALVILSLARGPLSLFGAWLLFGVAMATGLLETAFAALTRMYGDQARGPLTGVALLTGLSSTVGWPVSALFEHRFGWQGTCLLWALLNLILALPLNAWALKGNPAARSSDARVASTPDVSSAPNKRIWILTFVFATTGIVSNGLATNLPALFTALGASSLAAIGAASLMGPAQVGSRLLEFCARRWATPLTSARVAGGLHAIGAVVLGTFGAPAIAVFAVIQGGGNGILTIVRGTLPLALFGSQGFGTQLGKISVWARTGHAVAPFLFSAVIERYGGGVLFLSCALSMVAFIALFSGSLTGLPSGEVPSRED